MSALRQLLGCLEGNITASDLVGIYTVNLVGTSIDPTDNNFPPHNQFSSYVITGTATINTDNSGTLVWTLTGVGLTEHAPAANWTWGAFSFNQPSDG